MPAPRGNSFDPDPKTCYPVDIAMELSVIRLARLALAILLLAGTAAYADGFSPAQRDEIVKIVRDALKRDPTILRDALTTLQADEDKDHDRASTAAIARLGNAIVDPADPVEGNPNGDVTLVEFYDTRCPYCRRMLPTMTQLMHEEPGLKVVMKDLPILGPASQLESRALLAAQRQGGYFKLRDAIMQSPANPTIDSLRATAERVGLDGARLVHDMDDPAIKTRLAANVAMAQQLGIQGTPAMIVGHQMIAGAAEAAELRAVIAQARQQQ